MFERLKDIIFRSDYIQYIKHLGIDTTEVIDNIKNKLNDKDLFSVFENRSYSMLSPNIILENIIFEEVNRYLHKNHKDSVLFEEYIKLDIKTVIAHQNSLIERPNTKKPSEIDKGYKSILEDENNFIRIAKFENEMIEKERGFNREGQVIIFEGLSLFGEEHPFVRYLPSFLIWHNAFHGGDLFIIASIKKLNSIEAENILWLHQQFIDMLGLRLDNFNNGLQALNEEGEVILKFRQWRSNLIGNGASFVGQDSNVPQLEGCDLILREDYFEKLKMIIPSVKFYSDKIELKL